MANKLAKIVERDMPMTVGSRPMTADEKMRERRYRAEDALRTLTRAEEIRKDKALMDDVRAMAKERMKELKEFA